MAEEEGCNPRPPEASACAIPAGPHLCIKELPEGGDCLALRYGRRLLLQLLTAARLAAGPKRGGHWHGRSTGAAAAGGAALGQQLRRRALGLRQGRLAWEGGRRRAAGLHRCGMLRAGAGKGVERCRDKIIWQAFGGSASLGQPAWGQGWRAGGLGAAADACERERAGQQAVQGLRTPLRDERTARRCGRDSVACVGLQQRAR